MVGAWWGVVRLGKGTENSAAVYLLEAVRRAACCEKHSFLRGMKNLNTLVLSHNDIGSLGKSLHGMPDLGKVTSPPHPSPLHSPHDDG